MSIQAQETINIPPEEQKRGAKQYCTDEQRRKSGLKKLVPVRIVYGKTEISRFHAVGVDDVDKSNAGHKYAVISILGLLAFCVKNVCDNRGKNIVEKPGADVTKAVPNRLPRKFFK